VFALHYRELWASVSHWLTDELDQLAASAQAKWGKQHNNDGTHGDVTTAALEATSFRASDVFVYDVPATTNINSDSPGVSLVLPRKVSAIYLKGPIPSGGPYWFGIHSIEMPDAQEGDLLYIARTNGPFLINSVFSQSLPSGSFPPYVVTGNRLALDTDQVTSHTGDSVHYVDGWVQANPHGGTFLRVNNYDYDDLTKGLRFPAWVQIG
jgi:hypothetical protein